MNSVLFKYRKTATLAWQPCPRNLISEVCLLYIHIKPSEFEVPSRHFPGQTHVWRVAGWLQRGRARAKEELYCHVARAVALIVVVSRDRLLRDEPLSLIAGGKAFMEGLQRYI